MTKFSDVMQEAIVNWPWTESKYPRLEGMSVPDQDRFAFRHIIFHAQKSLGKLAEFEERLDHGAKLGTPARRMQGTVAAKMLINAYQLAHLAGLDPDSLLREVRVMLAKNA